MSNESVDGALITIGSAAFFVPKDDLDGFRLPDAVAAEAITATRQAPEVEGFLDKAEAEAKPAVIVAKYKPQELNYGGGWQFPLTLSRMCY